jgi:hypothetical protein
MAKPTSAMPSHSFGGGAAATEPRVPTSLPPGGDAQGAAVTGDAQPLDLSASELAFAVNAGGSAAPALEPPAAALDMKAMTSVWVNNQHVSGLWCINQNRNSWAAFGSAGWQKFANNSDSAIVAFTLLAAHARDSQGIVNFRTEADKMIHEIYLW